LHYATASKPLVNECGRGLWPKKFKITEKGLAFLEKYWELQNIMRTKSKQTSMMTVL
jgi:hypothetical protein